MKRKMNQDRQADSSGQELKELRERVIAQDQMMSLQNEPYFRMMLLSVLERINKNLENIEDQVAGISEGDQEEAEDDDNEEKE